MPAPAPTTSDQIVIPAAPHTPRRTNLVLIVHRVDVVRAGLAALVAGGTGYEVSSASLIHETIQMATERHPDVVVFEYGTVDGADACRLLASLWPRPLLVAIVERAGFVSPDMLAGGADAVVAIDGVSRETFVSVLRRVLGGERRLAAGFPANAPHVGTVRVAVDPVGSLTPREREMLYLIGEGLSNREIADTLVVSIKTVEAHRTNLARKLGLRSRAGLMRLALAGTVA